MAPQRPSLEPNPATETATRAHASSPPSLSALFSALPLRPPSPPSLSALPLRPPSAPPLAPPSRTPRPYTSLTQVDRRPTPNHLPNPPFNPPQHPLPEARAFPRANSRSYATPLLAPRPATPHRAITIVRGIGLSTIGQRRRSELLFVGPLGTHPPNFPLTGCDPARRRTACDPDRRRTTCDPERHRRKRIGRSFRTSSCGIVSRPGPHGG